MKTKTKKPPKKQLYIPDPYIFTNKSDDIDLEQQMAALTAYMDECQKRILQLEESMDECQKQILQLEESNSPKKLDSWIGVKERLPTAADGVTQLWMRGCSLTELVLGCHAVMFEHNEKIEGVLDMNKPDGLWDLSDFTHWMPLPKPPKARI